MSHAKTNEVCLLYKTRKISANTSRLDVDPACNSVLWGSEDVNGWQQDAEGHVNLVDDGGRVIAEFAPGPEQTLISVTAEPGSLILSPSS